MPIRRTTKNGRPAFQFGTTGKKFGFTAGNAESRERAKRRAKRQERAIFASGFRE